MIGEITQNALAVLFAVWWILLPLFLFLVFRDLWLRYARTLYIGAIPWVTLEVKIPRDILKTPKAMEVIFSQLHVVYSGGVKFIDKYFKGKVEDWFSLEIVGYAGGVFFFARCPAVYRNLAEAAIYSQYPDAEISETEDYTALLPSTLPNAVYDVWGADFTLARESAYPIVTYPFYEAAVEEQRLDPMAAVAEVMSKLKPDETIWIQLLVRPTGDAWKKEAETLIKGMLDQAAGKKAGSPSRWYEFRWLYDFARNLLLAPVTPPTWPEEKKGESGKEGGPPGLAPLTPGQREVVEQIEKKISKLGFETLIRFVYIDKRESFTRSNIAAVLGAFRQFNTLNLNGLKIDGRTAVKAKWPFFKKARENLKKRNIFLAYKARRFPAGPAAVFNVEELATVYHYPSTAVGAPMLRRVVSKKGEPPVNLPIAE